MNIPMRWGEGADRHIHIRHETPEPHSLEERASSVFPKDGWWSGGRPMKYSQRQYRRDMRRGIGL